MTRIVQATVVSRAEMMHYHDPERILGYCRSCEKYGAFWSCPPFDTAPLERLPAWSDAVLVTQRTPVDAAATPATLLRQFLDERPLLVGTLHQLGAAGTVAVIAGHCAGCATCTRSRNVDCAFPARMQYSLEALGFDVTGLAAGLAGQAVQWPASGIPDYLLMVGALLCPSRACALRVAAASAESSR